MDTPKNRSTFRLLRRSDATHRPPRNDKSFAMSLRTWRSLPGEATLKLLIPALLVILTMVITVTAALAQQGAPTITDDQVNQVAKQLYCPVCENIPLDVCPTTACAQWRGLIKEKLAAGWTENQIKDYFVQQYGARVLATPPANGLNWLVYIIPPIAILAGVYILYRAMRAWRQPVQAAANTSPAVSDEYIKRLEEELKKKK